MKYTTRMEKQSAKQNAFSQPEILMRCLLDYFLRNEGQVSTLQAADATRF